MSAAPHARSASHALPNRGGSRGFFGCPRNGGHSCASGYIQEAGGAVPDNEGGTSRYSLCVCDVCILRGGVQCQQRYFLGFGDIMHIDIVKAYIYDSLRWFIWKKESSGSPPRPGGRLSGCRWGAGSAQAAQHPSPCARSFGVLLTPELG